MANNLAANSTADCDYLLNAVTAWLTSATFEQTRFPTVGVDVENIEQNYLFLLWAQLLPVRCSWQDPEGVITYCPNNTDILNAANVSVCDIWNANRPPNASLATADYFARKYEVREGSVLEYQLFQQSYSDFGSDDGLSDFAVRVMVNESNTLAFA